MICHPSQNFVSSMASFKLASYTIFKDRKDGITKKQFLLDSGLVVMYETYWNQWTIISIFEAKVIPVYQKTMFDNIKILISIQKSISNIHKKSNEIKLSIQDIMIGFESSVLKPVKNKVSASKLPLAYFNRVIMYLYCEIGQEIRSING